MKCLDKVREQSRIVTEKGLSTDIEVDGGIYEENLPVVLDAGANIIVAGSAIFNNDISVNIGNFRKLMEE